MGPISGTALRASEQLHGYDVAGHFIRYGGELLVTLYAIERVLMRGLESGTIALDGHVAGTTALWT